MSQQDQVKQAYAYGVTLALQEVGMNKQAAEAEAVAFTREVFKGAEEPTTKEQVLTSLLGPLYASLSAEKGNKLTSLGHTWGKGIVGGAAGQVAGGGAGAGVGALASILSKGKIPMERGLTLGGLGGSLVGGTAGAHIGMQRGLRSSRALQGNDQEQEG